MPSLQPLPEGFHFEIELSPRNDWASVMLYQDNYTRRGRLKSSKELHHFSETVFHVSDADFQTLGEVCVKASQNSWDKYLHRNDNVEVFEALAANLQNALGVPVRVKKE